MMKMLIAAVAGAVFALCAQAQAPQQPTLSPKAQLAADNKAAAARYSSDKALCNDETSSSARLQCRRDAKAEYDAALAAAKARMAAATATPATAAMPAAAPLAAGCADCGMVTAVTLKEEAGQGGPIGMIAGGVGGALLGHQIGGGTGKTVATIAGAAGGAYAGKKIEEKMTTRKVWTITVQYPNSTRKSFVFEKDPGFVVGDPVRNSGASIVKQ
jgi:outer membrane lipoprotein SlyB